jgi:hypothetical protein
MQIELHPAVSLLEETFNVLIAPMEMLANALNSNLNLQSYKILYICGNYSRNLKPAGSQFHRSRYPSSLHFFPARDHPGREPPQLSDRGA